jgi:hypothetical protein
MEGNVISSKVEVAVPVIGYDWDGNSGQPLTSGQMKALLQRTSAQVFRDKQTSGELTFSYQPNHEVWFADAGSAAAVANLAKHYKSYGIAIWYFGGEGPDFWDMLGKQDAAPAEMDFPPSQDPPLARNPSLIQIFTDKVRGHYYFASDNDLNDTEKQIDSTITPATQQGKHWLDVRLNGTTRSEAGMTLSFLEDFRPFLKNGALQFYVRGIKGGETFDMGFFTAPRMGQQWAEMVGGTLHLSEYINLTTQWQLVTIPLMEFPQTASVVDAPTGQVTISPFRWHLVQTLYFAIQPGSDQWVEFQVANIRVVPSYDPSTVRKK